jgi:multicomponent Na+:H+ antiporter subunit A
LITGIGALIVIYASAYGITPSRRSAFFANLFVFMGSMLGLVLANDVILLYVFWELTSITSYLLIATSYEKPEAARSARQALLITSGGGLALLAGLLLLSQAAGTRELSTIVDQVSLTSDPRYFEILALIVLGAFTKSAIFPFHFWLPNAMTAPTPASAYLHSATMVKAGIYLLLRLRPTMGGTDAWTLLLGLAGATTVALAATRVLRQNDLKSVLAETTVIALGALVMMLGMSAAHASTAVIVFLVVHALYKSSLFMIVGIVDKRAGTRDIRELGGLARAMPKTASIAVVIGIAMMGLPPMFGFIGKELIYQTTLGADRFAPLWTSAALGGNALTVSGALLVVHHTFFGRIRTTESREVTDASTPILIGPAILAIASLAFGVFHTWTATQLVAEAVRTVESPHTHVELRLWHGFQWALALSAITVIAGVVVYIRRSRMLDLGSKLPMIFMERADRIYDAIIHALTLLATGVTRFIQTGRLRDYVFVTIASAVLLSFGMLGEARTSISFTAEPFELAIVTLTIGAAFLAVFVNGRIVPLICTMVVGFGVAIVFVLVGAPDVAFTQFTVETLLVVLVTLALGRFYAPPVARRTPGVRLRDGGLALVFGSAFFILLSNIAEAPRRDDLPTYFLEESVPRAHGRNVVNTILVDFRALDTLGEITALGAAALGALALFYPERRV